VATTAAAPALRLLLRVRLARGKEVRGRLAERRGIDATPRPPGRLIWLHAASVGETMSILPVLSVLAEDVPTILLTTGTVLAQRLEPALAGRVLHRFAPLDVPRWAARFLDHWRPDVAGFVESELWPNLLAACRARRIPTMLINARLSERSLLRWQRVPGLARQVLDSRRQLRSDGCREAARLGCCRWRAGDLKLAAPPLPADETEPRRLRRSGRAAGGWPALIPASRRWSRHPSYARGGSSAADDHRPASPRNVVPPSLRRATVRGDGRRRRASGSWIPLANPALGIGSPASPSSAAAACSPGGGQNRRTGPSGCAIAVGPHTGNFTTTSPCCCRRGSDGGARRDGTGPLGGQSAARSIAAAGDGRAADAVQRHADLARRTAEL
jgi:3-deoxy-D-manno-octulosonic-acid transferase